MKSLFLFVLTFTALSLSANAKSLSKIKPGEPLPANRFTELAKVVNPAVVNINTTQLPKQTEIDPRLRRDPFFEFFAPFMGPMQRQPAQSLGTGFIIRKDGLIITNNHVIDKADIIKVQLSDKDSDSYEAEVIGKDARTDIALIKITGKKEFPVVPLGSSETLEVGEWVAAFGNPFGHGHSMTKGIISALGRSIDELNRFPFLQTDASINPGNSGGPLVNMQGEVIGVNSAIDARAQGIGFAIPIDNVKSIIESLEKDGGIKRGFLGVSLAGAIDPRAVEYLKLKSIKGALVEHVFPGTPADKAGIKPYDFITKAGKKNIESSSDLIRAIADAQVGQKMDVVLTRDGKERTLAIIIEEHPDDTKGKESKPIKKYFGQKAPFDFGFTISDITNELRKNYRLPQLPKPHPVVVEVIRGSKASRSGLSVGDVILDINKTPVHDAKQALKALKKDYNVLRILRGERALLLYMQ